MYIKNGMVYTVVYEADGIISVANFSCEGFAQRFSKEVNGKIFAETINRHCTDDELNPMGAMIRSITEDNDIKVMRIGMSNIHTHKKSYDEMRDAFNGVFRDNIWRNIGIEDNKEER